MGLVPFPFGLSLCFPQTFLESQSLQQPCWLPPTSLGAGAGAGTEEAVLGILGTKRPSHGSSLPPRSAPSVEVGWARWGPRSRCQATRLRPWVCSVSGPCSSPVASGSVGSPPFPSHISAAGHAQAGRAAIAAVGQPALVGPRPSGSSPELRVSTQTNSGISGAREAGTVGPSALGPPGQCAGPGMDAHQRASQPCWTSRRPQQPAPSRVMGLCPSRL